MKKSILLAMLCIGTCSSFAQLEVTTKSLELQPLNKHKDWRIVEAGKTAANEIYIKFGKPACDMSKNAWTGDKTFRGLSWNIDKLIFNAAFEYQKTEPKTYSNSEEAVKQNENVFGNSFMPLSTKGIGGILTSSTAMPTRRLSNRFVFSNIILPAVGISGFKIKTSYITCGPVGATCTEVPMIMELNTQDAKEEKGQRWIPAYNNPEPNGGNILFVTAGVNTDETKTHYVFRKYNEHGVPKLEKTITLDYQCIMMTKELETAPGVFDYVLVANTINYKKSKAALAPANQYEYFRIDGTSFEIKENIKFTGTYSKMTIDEVIEKDGALYIMGACGNSATDYMDFYVKPNEKKGFQVIKISGGKVEYVKAITEKEAQAFVKIPEGLKGSADASFQLTAQHVKVVNGRVCYEAQMFEDYKYGSLVNMVFGKTGELEAYLVKPWKEMARYASYFSKDGSIMYWLVEDLGEYNTLQGSLMLAKKARDVASAVGIVKYNLDTKTAAPFQSLVNDEWAMHYNNPLLYENDQEIVLNGIKLTKKAKEGEVVFVTIKK